jgi:heme/copper-type cytochrome/quinol oxidase subunit 2
MNLFNLPSSTASADWVIFLVMVLAVGVAVGIVFIWAVLFRPKTKKKHHHKHRRKRHKRQHNPTLAQTGGLPPLRDPNQPPPGA